jgi:hypothetical protein
MITCGPFFIFLRGKSLSEDFFIFNEMLLRNSAETTFSAEKRQEKLKIDISSDLSVGDRLSAAVVGTALQLATRGHQLLNVLFTSKQN